MIHTDLLNAFAIKQSLEDLATRIQRSGDRDAAQRLSSLAVAVEKRGTVARQWSNTDIAKVIDPDSIVEGYRSRRISAPGSLIELMEVIRNASIFLPIIVTWYGVSQATDAYTHLLGEILTKDPNQASLPFLYLWQQGFGGRLPAILTLSSIAWIDAIILLAILILTLLVHSFSNAHRVREERHAQELHAELVHAISRATLYLQDRSQQVVTPNEVKQSAQNIEDLANRVIASFQKLGDEMMARFDNTVKQIAGQMVAQLHAGGQYLNQLGAAAGAVNQLAGDIGAAAQRLEDANREMSKSLQALLQPARDLAQQQMGLLTAVNKTTTQLEDNAKLLQLNATTLQKIAKDQNEWSDDFAEALVTLNSATRKIDEMVTKIGSFVGQQTTFLSQLGEERDAQARLAENMTQATLGMQDALKHVHAITNDMRRLAVDTNDLLRLYAALPSTVRTDMANIVNGYIKAAQVISKGGSDLSDAATTIFNVVGELERVIKELEKRLAVLSSQP